jgi:hypothetical protein
MDPLEPSPWIFEPGATHGSCICVRLQQWVHVLPTNAPEFSSADVPRIPGRGCDTIGLKAKARGRF